MNIHQPIIWFPGLGFVDMAVMILDIVCVSAVVFIFFLLYCLSPLSRQKDGLDNFAVAHLKYCYCVGPVESNVTADLHAGGSQTFAFIQKVAPLCAIALIVRSRFADND